MVLHSSIGGVNSRAWLNKQPRNEWLSINNIPSEIIKSVWAIIETNQVELHKDKPLYRLK